MSTDESGQRERWTPGIGLRRGLVHQLIWGTVCTVVVAACLALASPALNEVPVVWEEIGIFGIQTTLLVLGVAAVLSVPVLWLLWKRLQTAAGFTGALLGAVAVITIGVVAGAGAVLATAIGDLDGRMGLAVALAMSAICLGWIYYEVATD